jgi:hypothetical protein
LLELALGPFNFQEGLVENLLKAAQNYLFLFDFQKGFTEQLTPSPGKPETTAHLHIPFLQPAPPPPPYCPPTTQPRQNFQVSRRQFRVWIPHCTAPQVTPPAQNSSNPTGIWPYYSAADPAFLFWDGAATPAAP